MSAPVQAPQAAAAPGVATVTGTLARHNPRWSSLGYLVVESSTDPALRPHSELPVVGPLVATCTPGSALVVTGEVVTHPRHGRQLEVATLEDRGVTTRHGAHAFLTRLDGVGPRRADAITHHHPDPLALLSSPPAPGEPDPLCDVPGIGAATAAAIRESWARCGEGGDRDALVYLDALGLTQHEAAVVVAEAKRRGQPAAEWLRTDAYELTRHKGFGFARADKIARKAGVALDAPGRVEAAVRWKVAELIAEEGDTVLSAADVVRRVAERACVATDAAWQAVDRLAASGEVLLSVDEAGKQWMRDPELYRMERAIWRAVRGG